ncbi:fumarate hydratase, partial [candidate division WOR-3 bacterium]|nr:fumarate hydratase [candidate division WOR-3 bacterium]
MREIPFEQVRDAVARLCIDSNCEIPEDVVAALKRGIEVEESPTGKEILGQIIENTEISRRERLPACQDTGWAVVWVEIGSG